MNTFPGLNPDPPMDYYMQFLADQNSTLLLIAMARLQVYQNLYLQLSQAADAAEAAGNPEQCLALHDLAGRAWDQAVSYGKEAALLIDIHLN